MGSMAGGCGVDRLTSRLRQVVHALTCYDLLARIITSRSSTLCTFPKSQLKEFRVTLLSKTSWVSLCEQS